MKIVFVYGTLRKEQPNSYLLRDSRFLGKYYYPEGIMVSMGGFPGLIETLNAGKPNTVEAYEVSDETLEELDILEGHPNWYFRTPVTIGGHEGFIYLLPDVKQYHDLPKVESGDWVEYRRRMING